MSASLVGSEMCIRDRPSSARLPSLRPPRLPLPLPRLSQPARPRTGAAPCLLYTSDAADDM
eukprot:12102917-Alexandrium_andersonii.AAC.1